MKLKLTASLSPNQIRANENFFIQLLDSLTEGGIWIWPEDQSLFIKRGNCLLGNEKALNSIRQIVSPEFFKVFFGLRN